MQVALVERKNIVLDDAGAEGSEAIPAGLDRLDLILEADAKRNLKRDDTKERLDNIDAIIAYIMNTLDDDAGAEGSEADLGVEDSEAYEDPDAGADDDPLWIDEPFGPPDDPYADIEIPPPDGREADLDAGAEGNEVLPALPPGLIDNREQWRDIDRYQNYEVSHHGRVRNKTTGRILRLQPNGTGYLRAALYARGVRSQICVHKLVAEAWLPNPENKPEVDHIDGNKENNMIHNLRWCTRAENMQNRGMFRNNTTGRKGTSRAPGGKYKALIQVGGRRIYLGTFDTVDEAGDAYDAAALEHHGEFAR